MTENDTIKSKSDTVKHQNDTVSDTVLNSIVREPHITAVELAGKSGLGIATVKRHIKKLKDAGKIERVGSDKTGHWKVKEDHNNRSKG